MRSGIEIQCLSPSWSKKRSPNPENQCQRSSLISQDRNLPFFLGTMERRGGDLTTSLNGMTSFK